MPTSLPLRRTAALLFLLVAALILTYFRTGTVLPGVSVASAHGSYSGFQCYGTRFFKSAGVGAVFTEGDTHAGGTFTYIENDNYMEVRDNPESDPIGMIVGEFEQPKRLGDVAVIEFSNPIWITGIYWYDNDPKSPPEVPTAEAGWSFNGIAGPLTGDKQAQWQKVNLVTNKVTISAGDDSGGVDFCYMPTRTVYRCSEKFHHVWDVDRYGRFFFGKWGSWSWWRH
ncbi:MAG TPA: hypothetical protein VIA82_01620 [Candidatus Limnocylindria bacterium]|jgi:hypothetical protein